MTRSPKQIFLASPYRKAHEDWVLSPQAENACLMALMALEHEMPQSLGNPSQAWDYGAQMIGARRVIEILLTLHEPPEEPKKPLFRNLPPPK